MPDKYQIAADAVTSEILRYFYGKRFTLCANIENDQELDRTWEYFNEFIYESIKDL